MFNSPLALAHSPSGWAILCIAVGDIPIGMETLSPNTVVDKSLTETSLKHLGRILYLLNNINIKKCELLLSILILRNESNALISLFNNLSIIIRYSYKIKQL